MSRASSSGCHQKHESLGRLEISAKKRAIASSRYHQGSGFGFGGGSAIPGSKLLAVAVSPSGNQARTADAFILSFTILSPTTPPNGEDDANSEMAFDRQISRLLKRALTKGLGAALSA
jgi:hypothetical protein